MLREFELRAWLRAQSFVLSGTISCAINAYALATQSMCRPSPIIGSALVGSGREWLTFDQRHQEQRRQLNTYAKGGASGASVTAVANGHTALSQVRIVPGTVEVCGSGDRFAIGHAKPARWRMPTRIARSRKGAKAAEVRL